MITTTDATSTLTKVLKAGTITTYSTESTQFHVVRRTATSEEIITEGNGNLYTIVDSTVDTDGSISVVVDLLEGRNIFSLIYSDNADLDAGSVLQTKMGGGVIKRITNETSINI